MHYFVNRHMKYSHLFRFICIVKDSRSTPKTFCISAPCQVSPEAIVRYMNSKLIPYARLHSSTPLIRNGQKHNKA